MIKIHCGSFRDKYLALFAALLISFSLSAQYDSTKNRQTQSSYGFDNRNTRSRESAIIPNDTTKLALKDSGAIAYKGGYYWGYNGVHWSKISGGSGTDSAAIRSAKQPTDSVSLYLSDLKDSTIKIVFVGDTSSGGGASGDSIVSILKNATRDSIITTMYDGRRFAVKDSVGIGGGGSGITKAQLPLKINAAGDSITRRWNVLDYLPGFASGVTDATAGIQAAINACDAAGGGEVFFPNNIYIIGGPILGGGYNSQIYIPRRSILTSARNTIILQGESSNLSSFGGGLALGATVPPPVTGAILKSTLTTFSAAGQAVIATIDSSGYFNTTSLIVNNLGIQVKNNPAGTGPVVGGINWRYGANMSIDKTYIVIDTAGYNSVMPYHDISAIETPNAGSGESYSISNTLVGGFKIGYKIGEHVLLSNTNAMVCYFGFYFKDGPHASNSIRSGSQWCAYNIYAGGYGVLSNFQIDTEWQQIGKWYDDIATIKDSANLLTGQVFYTVAEAGIGKNNSKFSISGGGNLHYLSNDDGVSGIITVSPIGSTPNANGLSLTNINKNINLQPASSSFGGIVTTVAQEFAGAKTFVAAPYLQSLNAYVGGIPYLGYGGVIQASSDLIWNSTYKSFNFGGITPSVWTNQSGILEGDRCSIFMGQAGDMWSSSNAYYNSAWKYKSTGKASNIGLYDGEVQLRVASSGAANSSLTWLMGLLVKVDQTVQMPAYGAGTATFDASGNITSVSDERLKTDIQYYKSGLKELMKLKPIQYKWNRLSGNETKETYAGFSAQNVKANIPFGTGENKDGYLSLQDRAIMATLVNAVQEQQKQIEELKAEINKLKK